MALVDGLSRGTAPCSVVEDVRVAIAFPRSEGRDARVGCRLQSAGAAVEDLRARHITLLALTALMRVVGQREAGGLGVTDVLLVVPPGGLKEFVEVQVAERGYGTSSEFIGDLIRREQARTQLRALVVDGMGSGPGSELDETYFQALRERIKASGAA
jgi:antitoxin ParD1/3/4